MFGHKKACFCILILTSVLVCVSSVYGYIPQGRHLIQLMLEGLNLPGTMYVRQHLVVSDAGIDSQGSGIEQNVRIRLPEQYRSDIDTGQMHQFQVATPGGAMTVIGSQMVSETQSWMDCYKDLLIYRSRERLADRLAQTGVNLSATGLGRFNGGICYIIGAAHENAPNPQVWISKDTFFPVRWLLRDGQEKGGLSEIRYQRWQHADGFWYPFEIEFLKNGRMIRKIEVISVEKGIVFSDRMFDLSVLRRQYAPKTAVDGNHEGKSEIETEIENFKRMFE